MPVYPKLPKDPTRKRKQVEYLDEAASEKHIAFRHA